MWDWYILAFTLKTHAHTLTKVVVQILNVTCGWFLGEKIRESETKRKRDKEKGGDGEREDKRRGVEKWRDEKREEERCRERDQEREESERKKNNSQMLFFENNF